MRPQQKNKCANNLRGLVLASSGVGTGGAPASNA